MAFTTLRTWVTGEIVTAAQLNEQIRDNGNEYIQRTGSIPLTANWDAGSFEIRAQTLESDVATGTAPLTIASTTVVTNLNADQVDGQERALKINADHTHQSTGAEGGKIDHGLALDGLSDDDHTQYALRSILTTRGDIIYRDASAWARLAKGAEGSILRMGANDPAWSSSAKTTQFFVPCFTGSGGALAVTYGAGYHFDGNGDYAMMTFKVPADFSTLTSVKVILIPTKDGVGTFDWTVNTTFGANGEAYNVHTDSATADAQAVVTTQILELDISAAFTGLAANDIANVKFTLDSGAAVVLLDVMGLDVKYS